MLCFISLFISHHNKIPKLLMYININKIEKISVKGVFKVIGEIQDNLASNYPEKNKKQVFRKA